MISKHQSGSKPPRLGRDMGRMKKKTSNTNALSETLSFANVQIMDPTGNQNLMSYQIKGSSCKHYSDSGKSMRVRSHSSAVKDKKSVSQFQCVEYQTCLLHGKPADLICLKDRAIVCCNCALFGEHKGHDVINIEGLLSKIANYTESCLEIYEKLKTQDTQTNQETIRDQVQKCLFSKKAEDQKKIEEQYKNLASILKISQKKALIKIDSFYKQKLEQFDKRIGLQKTRDQMERWFAEIDKLGSFISDINNIQTYLDAIKYVDDSGYGNSLIGEGQKLLDEFKKAQKTYESKIQEEFRRDIIIFDKKLKKDLQNYCLVENYGRRKRIIQEPRRISNDFSLSDGSPQNTPTLDFGEKPTIDDYLLASITYPMQDVPLDTLTQKQIKIENIPILEISDIKVNTLTNNSSEEHSGIKEESVEIIIPERKRRKIEVSEKYKGTIDDLRYDRAEIIDLTGAEIGDNNVLALSDFIKKSRRLRVLKLIKNRLTDECLSELLQSIKDSNVISLNLSQNSLSDKAINIVEALHPTGLRTLTITLNRINRRNVKGKVDKLTRSGLSIVL